MIPLKSCWEAIVPGKIFLSQYFFVAIRYLYCYITSGYSPISNFPWPHVARHGASLLLSIRIDTTLIWKNIRRELQQKMRSRTHANENQTS